MSALGERIAAAMKPGRLDTFIEMLEQTGVVSISANAAGQSRVTFYLRRKIDPAFAERWAKAKSIANVEVNKEVRRRAITGVDEDVYFQGEKVGKKKVHSDSLLIMLAKASSPEFKDQSRVIHTTPEDERDDETDRFANMSEKQLRAFVKMAEGFGVGDKSITG